MPSIKFCELLSRGEGNIINAIKKYDSMAAILDQADSGSWISLEVEFESGLNDLSLGSQGDKMIDLTP